MSTPRHIAFIMDGNGRWAQERGLPRTEGHKAGVRSLEAVVDQCIRIGVQYCSFYAFSTENWKRPAREIGMIFRLMEIYFRRRKKTLLKRNVRIIVSGDIDGLPATSREICLQIMAATATATGTTVNFCLNYGGQAELRRACALWSLQCRETGDFSVPDEEEMRTLLYGSDLPDVDLMIRTGGDRRISNFLLYQLAYAELRFLNVAWPDFGESELMAAISDFAKTERRIGGLAAIP